MRFWSRGARWKTLLFRSRFRKALGQPRRRNDFGERPRQANGRRLQPLSSKTRARTKNNPCGSPVAPRPLQSQTGAGVVRFRIGADRVSDTVRDRSAPGVRSASGPERTGSPIRCEIGAGRVSDTVRHPSAPGVRSASGPDRTGSPIRCEIGAGYPIRFGTGRTRSAYCSPPALHDPFVRGARHWVQSAQRGARTGFPLHDLLARKTMDYMHQRGAASVQASYK